MKNVLVLLHDDQGQEARLQVALDLTRALSGHLMCLDAIVPPTALTDYVEVSGGAMMMEIVRERESENRRAVEARLRQEDVAWTMIEKIGAPAHVLENACALADVIVVSIPDEHSESEFRGIVGELTVKSDRPVLAVPAACRGLDVTGSVLVSWNATDQASEALRQAIPLLRHASAVTLLEVNDPAGGVWADEAASYLSRHDVRVEVVRRRMGERSVSEVILDEVQATAAAYVVMGAYGLPRMMEALLGGATVGMLRKTPVPLFLAR